MDALNFMSQWGVLEWVYFTSIVVGNATHYLCCRLKSATPVFITMWLIYVIPLWGTLIAIKNITDIFVLLSYRQDSNIKGS